MLPGMHPGRLPPMTPLELGAGPSTPEPPVTGGGRRSVSAGGGLVLEPTDALSRPFTPGSVLRPGVVALPGSVVSPGRLNAPVDGTFGLPLLTPGVLGVPSVDPGAPSVEPDAPRLDPGVTVPVPGVATPGGVVVVPEFAGLASGDMGIGVMGCGAVENCA
jgi:hypothetical protein